MLLYLKNLGASGTILGIATALIPFFSILQIPAANLVEKTGYKTFLVRGWGSRSIFILGITIAAFLPESVKPQVRIGLILAMLACFAMARGVSMSGYLPWITGIVPESLRGTFLARDTMCMYLAITGTMVLSSLWVSFLPSARSFGVLFLFSYLAALGSVLFLRRIPDIPADSRRPGCGHPPWRTMLLYPPFFKYVAFTVVFNVFVSAIGVIWVPFMRDSYGAPGKLILVLSGYASIIGAIASRLTGPAVDRVGSRPLLAFASGLVIISQSLWMMIAAGALPRALPILFLTTSFSATGFAVIGLSGTRLLMGLVPVMGRSHFFAICNVANSLTLGLLPIAWGLLLDAASKTITSTPQPAQGWNWNPYSTLYAVAVAGMLAAQLLRRRLDEPKAMPTEEFMRILFVKSPARLVARVMQPLRRLLPPV